MNVKNKITKASALRNTEAVIQAANNRFGFKVEGEGTYVWTEGTKDYCNKLAVISYEMVVSGNNSFWVIKTLDGNTLVVDCIEYTMPYYMRARTAKAKVGDYKIPHLCFGYWDCFGDKIEAIEEKDLAEMEALGDTDSFYRWLVDRNTLLKATFKGGTKC